MTTDERDIHSKILDILRPHFVGVSLGVDAHQINNVHGKAAVIFTPTFSHDFPSVTVGAWYTTENVVVSIWNLDGFIESAKMAMGGWFVKEGK